MTAPSRRSVVVAVSGVSLVLVAALHLYIVIVSATRALFSPSPDRLGLTTTHHLVDLSSSAAYLVSIGCCAWLLGRYFAAGRSGLVRSRTWLWVGATAGGLIAAAALTAVIGAAVIDYNWSYQDYVAHGDASALIMDFMGAFALSFPILAPVACLWFERIDA